MKANGQKAAKRRYTRAPKMEAAISEQSTARSQLTIARRSNDSAAIAAAQRSLELAGEQLRVANVEQFERIAELRTNTALRAIEELVKLVSQRRYIITQQHLETITGAIDGAGQELKVAMQAAMTRQRPSIRRAVIFGSGAVPASRQH